MDDRVKRAVRQAIASAEKTGQITYAELKELLPTAVVTSEEIVEVLSQLSELGIHLVEA